MKMKKNSFARNFITLLFCLILGLCVLIFVSCSKDKTAGGSTEETQGIAINDKTVAGVSQKGPFVKGASVHLYGLDWGSFAQSGSIFTGKINSDHGDFKVTGVNLRSQYALLEANGYYRNEVTGEKSNSPITLFAMTDLSDRENVNINLLTHLEYERVLRLIEDGKSVKDAKKLAEQEILKSFYVDMDVDEFEDLNIFNDGKGDAALLAISILLQGNRAEADLSELLTEYALDMEQDGEWDDEKTKAKIADWAEELSLTCSLGYEACNTRGTIAAVRQNIEKWDLSDVVPEFETYVYAFWWMNYGLGNCEEKRQGEVKDASNEMSANNGVSYICDGSMWRRATDFEADTYKWKNGEDGDIKKGDKFEKHCYVFENDKWNLRDSINCKLGIRGCTESIFGDVRRSDDGRWRYCDGKNWVKATDLEVEGCSSSEQDSVTLVKVDSVDVYLVCRDGKWLRTDESSFLYGTCYEKFDLKISWEAQGQYAICVGDVWENAKDMSKVNGSCNSLNEGIYVPVSGGGYGRCADGKWVGCTQMEYEENWEVGRGVVAKYGACSADRENVVVEYSMYYYSMDMEKTTYRICRSGKWTETDQFTYENGACTSVRESEVIEKLGEWGYEYHICKSGEWKVTNRAAYVHGECTSTRENEAVKDDGGWTYWICKSDEWVETNSATYEYGLCTPARENERVSATEEKQDVGYYICKSGEWARTDWGTYEFGECTSERKNEVAGGAYVCKSGTWEYDYLLLSSSSGVEDERPECTSSREGETTKIFNSYVEETYFVCKSWKWIETDRFTYENGGCTSSREGEVIKISYVHDDAYFICKSGEWIEMGQATYENGECTSSREGEGVMISNHDGDKTYFVCKSDEWIATDQVTYENGKCMSSREGEVVMISSHDGSKIYFVCKSWKWEEVKKDEFCRTLYLSSLSKEKGACTIERENELTDYSDPECDGVRYYRCLNEEWTEVAADLFISKGICTSTRENEVVVFEGQSYICKSNEWVEQE